MRRVLSLSALKSYRLAAAARNVKTRGNAWRLLCTDNENITTLSGRGGGESRARFSHQTDVPRADIRERKREIRFLFGAKLEQ